MHECIHALVLLNLAILKIRIPGKKPTSIEIVTKFIYNINCEKNKI
jgi:hypothetical protein